MFTGTGSAPVLVTSMKYRPGFNGGLSYLLMLNDPPGGRVEQGLVELAPLETPPAAEHVHRPHTPVIPTDTVGFVASAGTSAPLVKYAAAAAKDRVTPLVGGSGSC